MRRSKQLRDAVNAERGGDRGRSRNTRERVGELKGVGNFSVNAMYRQSFAEGNLQASFYTKHEFPEEARGDRIVNYPFDALK